MDQDDAEKRIADLERELAVPRTAREERDERKRALPPSWTSTRQLEGLRWEAAWCVLNAVIIGSVMIAVLDVTSGIGRAVCFAIALFSSVVFFSVREYRFRRTHPPEERAAQRAALAAKKQLRRDRHKSVAGSTLYKRKVLRTGAEARAVITAAHDLESATEYEYLVYLELVVTIGADPPYTVCTGEMCSGMVADMSSLWVGRELVVRVDLTDRQRVAVDWRKSKQ